MKRFLFEYEVISTRMKREFSIVSEDEETAKELLKERVSDLEFTDEADIRILGLIKTLEVDKQFFECEGCT